jgi:hypothetical protein
VLLDPRQKRQRQPECLPVRKLEAIAHDANDGRRRAVDSDGSTDDTSVAVIAGRPKAVTEDDDPWRARSIVFGQKSTSQYGRLAKDGERVLRHVGAGEASGDSPSSPIVRMARANAPSEAKLREARHS